MIDFDQIPPAEELVDILWNTWLQLELIRGYLYREAASHALSLMIMEQLDAHQEDITATLYGKDYLVKFDLTNQRKSNQHRQKFGIYDKGQLVTDGSLDFFLREPNDQHEQGISSQSHGSSCDAWLSTGGQLVRRRHVG